MELKFNDVAESEQSPVVAYSALHNLYTIIRVRNTRHEKVNATIALINSPYLMQIANNTDPKHENIWHVVDFICAAMEQIESPKEIWNLTVLHELLNQLKNFYPKAGVYYEEEMQRLVDGGNQDVCRKVWQSTRRTMMDTLNNIAANKEITDYAKETMQKIALLNLIQAPIGVEKSKNTPWSWIDCLKAVCDAYPLNGKTLFAKEHLMESDAYKTVALDCPQFAKYFELKFEEMRRAEQKMNSQKSLEIRMNMNS